MRTADNGHTGAPQLSLGMLDYALLALPWGWLLVWVRLWDAYQALPDGAARGAGNARPQARYDAAGIDWLDQTLLMIPYGWPLAALRHAESLLNDTLGIRATLLDRTDPPPVPSWLPGVLALAQGALTRVGMGPAGS